MKASPALLLFTLAGSACTSSAGQSSPPMTANTIAVLPLSYAEGSGWEKVQRECDLQRHMPAYIHEYFPAAIPVNATPASGKVLEVEVVHMLAPGGGFYSGPKQLTVHGRLLEGGQIVASFQARRTTMGGAFGGWKGTCAFMRRNAKALGKDISFWLEHPTMDARLGEL